MKRKLKIILLNLQLLLMEDCLMYKRKRVEIKQKLFELEEEK